MCFNNKFYLCFKVKGLCTMSKEVLGGERPSPNKPVSTTVNGTTNSSADLIPATTYRGNLIKLLTWPTNIICIE